MENNIHTLTGEEQAESKLPDESKKKYQLILGYLKSSGKSEGSHYFKADWLILLLWLVLVCFLSFMHEPWRDEVRALSIARDHSFWSLLGSGLRNEGHPAVWYLILKLIYTLTQSTLALKISSVLVAFIAITLFYKYAPFPRWMKIIFLFTILPFYLYSAMARNYGISMLFMFLIAIELSRKKPLTFFLAIWLVLLANSNLHSIPLAILFLIYWNSDLLYKKHKLNENKSKFILVYTNVLAIIGILYAIWIVYPTGASSVRNSSALSWSGITTVLNEVLPHPGLYLNTVFHVSQVWIRDLVVILLFAGLLRNYRLALCFIIGVYIFNLIFGLVYQGYYRHQGLILIFAITLYWISLKDRQTSNHWYFTSSSYFQKIILFALFPLIFIFHLRSTQVLVGKDLISSYSGSKNLSQFLETNSELKNAILICEPDYFIESLPYYNDQSIYFPRTGKISRTTAFDTTGIEQFNLNALLDSATMLQKRTHKPVILLFGFPDFGKLYNSDQEVLYGRSFSWTEESMNRFYDQTVFLTQIDKALYENYTVYRLKDH